MITSVPLFLFQLAVVLFAAKLGGEICHRYLKQPTVLGELVMGMIIGPYALGGIPLPGIGPLFTPFMSTGAHSTPSNGNELYLIAQVAIILLLFSAGLGTDFRQFFRFAGPASIVALGGEVFSFAFAALVAVAFGLADHFLSPGALFIGAIVGSTSVSIAARVIRDMGKLGTPEGITILAADVIDDVMGILILTVVIGITTIGEFHAVDALLSLGKAVGFWLALTAAGILLAKYIVHFIISFRVAGSAMALALALALFSSGLAEEFGLATIVGAYAIGLALSNTELANILARPMDTLHHIFVPIFFVVMGMLVDFQAVWGVFLFGLAIVVVAIVGKIIGCGLPSLGIGFNWIGAARIGFGMVPRGEVSLIIAGIALTRGLIPSNMFGVAVMLVIFTAVITTVVLPWLFKKGGAGRRT